MILNYNYVLNVNMMLVKYIKLLHYLIDMVLDVLQLIKYMLLLKILILDYLYNHIILLFFYSIGIYHKFILISLKNNR
jgi:hypothetical protein